MGRGGRAVGAACLCVNTHLVGAIVNLELELFNGRCE
jgi:hypothetical protein